jgi:hypothetical protein
MSACVACGDRASERYEGKSYCQECYEELAFGVVNPASARLYFSTGRGHAAPFFHDEAPPSWENAMRALED